MSRVAGSGAGARDPVACAIASGWRRAGCEYVYVWYGSGWGQE